MREGRTHEEWREQLRKSALGRRLHRARWRAELTARWLTPGRPLPQYLILGAQKGGTTSLYDWLCAHPRVRAPRRKEVHYFDINYHYGLSWYRAFFPRLGPGEITGEASPYYLYHPHVPHRVAASLPDTRFVVLLRDPVERAISHHNHERALGLEPLELEEAIEREPERLAGAYAPGVPQSHDLLYAHGHYSYVDRGRYADQLERWWSWVSRDCMLVLFSEELFARPAETLRRTQEWLGLEPHVPADLSPRNARTYEKGHDGIRDRLRETFAEDNERLATLLGRDLPWD